MTLIPPYLVEDSNKVCIVDNCNNKPHSKGYCGKHYMQLKRDGYIKDRTRNTPNEIRFRENYAELIMYDKDLNESIALIDIEDIPKISKYKWHKRDNLYVNSHKVGRLHRYLLKAPANLDVDHINGNRLDNRKCNLRLCTRSQNNMNKSEQSNNTSGHRGVSWSKSNSKWHSRITVNHKTINLGYYDNILEAIQVRQQAEKQYFGEFNKLS